MRIFMTSRFANYVEEEGIEFDSLVQAVQNIDLDKNKGQWSDLGGNVYKVRVARKGKGSSGGYRVIILLRRGDRAFLVRGFAKNRLANISKNEVKLFKAQADDLLNWDEHRLVKEEQHKTLRRL